MNFKSPLILAAAVTVALATTVAVAGPEKGHPNIQAANRFVDKAIEKMRAAQQANEYDMQGHALKAEQLLNQAAAAARRDRGRGPGTRLHLGRRLLELGGRAPCVGARPLDGAAPGLLLGAPYLGPRRQRLAPARRLLGQALRQRRVGLRPCGRGACAVSPWTE